MPKTRQTHVCDGKLFAVVSGDYYFTTVCWKYRGIPSLILWIAECDAATGVREDGFI
jgi:hypothetical protein